MAASPAFARWLAVLHSCPAGRSFFFKASATTGFNTLSLHDALPISRVRARSTSACAFPVTAASVAGRPVRTSDRKSTRLNSSHANISYAVFCLKKKKEPDHRGEPWRAGVAGDVLLDGLVAVDLHRVL